MSSFFRRAPHPDDLDTDEEDEEGIDPNLRLRTVRTAASTIAESIQTEIRRDNRRKRKNTRKSFFSRNEKKKQDSSAQSTQPAAAEPTPAQVAIQGRRRNIYLNTPLNPEELDTSGEPSARYARNKVKTSKYTILTFLPKNLYEQFRRVANLYFLALVCIQVFKIFGAAAPQVAMLPLVVILSATALKDGVEDYRRAKVDDEVNNSAATKLGSWRNVNQPADPRNWFEKLLGIGGPDKVSKGVRKLREREASSGHKIVINPRGDSMRSVSTTVSREGGPGARSLDDIQSVGTASFDHSYPPSSQDGPNPSITALAAGDQGGMPNSAYTLTNRSGISGVSSGVIDWQRRVPGTARWERTLWKKLEVGDIVLLRDNEQIPADIAVLSTSDADGMCFVETKNLDGETNLKPRKSLKATSMLVSEEDVEHAAFVLDSEPPHPNLYSYNGILRYKAREQPNSPNGPLSPGQEKLEPVTINEFILRGCTVRNTTWIIGLVVFTGADTKIMMNGGATPSKRSKIEKETNFNVVMNFLILILMCSITAVINGLYDTKFNSSARFYEQHADVTNHASINAIVTFASCLIAFQNIVPISLYISIEIVKTIQAYFINQDIDMYYEPYDTCCVPKTWNISDDLGQVEYIFSDKTGTLTQNIMEFQKCSIHGVAYGEGITEAMRGAAKRTGQELSISPEEQAAQIQTFKDDMLQRMTKAFKNRYLRPDKMTLVSPKLIEDLTDRSSPQRNRIIAFFRALAVCHTVLPDKIDPSNQYVLDYKAESPDEAALVAAARDVGFPFVSKSNAAIEIEVMGQTERYVPLRVLEFNSTRKRMSVIVRNPEGKLVLYCKGADSVIYSRLVATHDQDLKVSTSRDLEAFANGGLRTLCIAYRYLKEEEYLEWSRHADAAASAIQNREEEIDRANEMIEHSLEILGATALEDKLQEGVPQTIEQLHRAGIKLWILTGDKLQTAIEIGFSCNLLKSDMEVMILSADSAEAARAQIEAGLNKIASILGPPIFDHHGRQQERKGGNGGFAVVIDGDTLRFALAPDLKPLFLNLGTQCDTVVCCRVSPAQKAMTVKLVKEGRNALTLSIGDGANDVAMIQEANIGCGLFGLEGSQAAMSADYAFGQFRFLTKLLLVHGRWSYVRVADMHKNFFYKNVIWTFAMFWFLFFNNFDGTYLYEYTFILLYNLAFTSLPVIILGAFDQDLNAKATLAFPQLYKRGIRGLEYTRTQFWLYMLDGLYQSAIVFFIPWIVWTYGNPVSWNGKTVDSLPDFGTTASVAAIFAANLFVGFNTRYWTVITWVVVVGSTLVMLLWIAIYSFFTSVGFNREVIILFSTIDFWATLLLAVALALAPRYICRYWKIAYDPLDKDIIREAWVMGNLKDELGIQHRYRRNRNPVTRERDASIDAERGEYEPTGTQTPIDDALSPPSTAILFPASAALSSSMTSPTQHGEHSPAPRKPHSPLAVTSPVPSYYSSSEIPLSSPGIPPGSPERSSARGPTSPTLRVPPQGRSNPNSTQRGSGEAYEMSARAPVTPNQYATHLGAVREVSTPQGLHSPEPTSDSRLSFVTADDAYPWDRHDDDGDADDDTDDRSTIQGRQSGTIRSQHIRDSQYSGWSDSPHAL